MKKDYSLSVAQPNRAYRLAQYGLSQPAYEAMLEGQGGVCAICGCGVKRGKYLVIDHDHLSGKVRGLLCTKCNLGLGQFQDSIDNLTRAIQYLQN